ncbi:MAG: lamin tail domain-containing protein, partial [Candidatus Hydrogenedentota bacterium]
MFNKFRLHFSRRSGKLNNVKTRTIPVFLFIFFMVMGSVGMMFAANNATLPGSWNGWNNATGQTPWSFVGQGSDNWFTLYHVPSWGLVEDNSYEWKIYHYDWGWKGEGWAVGIITQASGVSEYLDMNGNTANNTITFGDPGWYWFYYNGDGEDIWICPGRVRTDGSNWSNATDERIKEWPTASLMGDDVNTNDTFYLNFDTYFIYLGLGDQNLDNSDWFVALDVTGGGSNVSDAWNGTYTFPDGFYADYMLEVENANPAAVATYSASSWDDPADGTKITRDYYTIGSNGFSEVVIKWSDIGGKPDTFSVIAWVQWEAEQKLNSSFPTSNLSNGVIPARFVSYYFFSGQIDDSGVAYCDTSIRQTGDLIIAEFNPDDDMTAYPQAEWFEIYNPTNRSIDLKNWCIMDGDGAEAYIATVPTTLPPGGHALVYADATAEYPGYQQESDTTGDLNRNGFIDVYVLADLMTTTDEDVFLLNYNTVQSEDSTVDFVVYTNNDATNSMDDMDDAFDYGQWCTGLNAEANAVGDIDNIDGAANGSFYRKFDSYGYLDENSKYDWVQNTSSGNRTVGYHNSSPTSITNVKIYDSTFSSEISTTNANENVGIEVNATDRFSSSRDFTSVNVYVYDGNGSDTGDTLGILQIQLRETANNSGIFRGYVYLSNSASNYEAGVLYVTASDSVKIFAIADTTKWDDVKITGADVTKPSITVNDSYYVMKSSDCPIDVDFADDIDLSKYAYYISGVSGSFGEKSISGSSYTGFVSIPEAFNAMTNNEVYNVTIGCTDASGNDTWWSNAVTVKKELWSADGSCTDFTAQGDEFMDSDYGASLSRGFYFTWDDTYFYVLWEGNNLNNDDVFIAFDTGPGRSQGATNEFYEGQWYSNSNYRPDVAIVFFDTNTINRYYNSGSALTLDANYASSWLHDDGTASDLTSELRVPRYYIQGYNYSRSDSIGIFAWIGENNNASGPGDDVYATWPRTNEDPGIGPFYFHNCILFENTYDTQAPDSYLHTRFKVSADTSAPYQNTPFNLRITALDKRGDTDAGYNQARGEVLIEVSSGGIFPTTTTDTFTNGFLIQQVTVDATGNVTITVRDANVNVTQGAINPQIYGTISLTFTAVNNAPYASNLYPGTGVYQNTRNPLLSWTFSDSDPYDTVGYGFHLQVSTTNNFLSPYYEAYYTDTTASSHQVSTNLNYMTPYWWRVRLIDNQPETGSWSNGNDSFVVQRIVLDGNSDDWDAGTPGSSNNSSVVDDQFWVWTDVTGDERTAGPNSDDNYDIKYMKIVGDTKYLYFYFEFTDITENDSVDISIVVDTNTSGNISWIGDDAGEDINTTTAFDAEMVLDLSVDGVYYFRTGASNWTSPAIPDDAGAPTSNNWISISNNIAEFKLPWSLLGVNISSSPELGFAVMTFAKTVNTDPSTNDHTIYISDGDGLDIVHPGPAEVSDNVEYDNTWNVDLYDQRLEFYFSVKFMSDGSVDYNLNPPQTPDAVDPEDHGKTTDTTPLIQWSSVSDPDNDTVTFYQFQLSDNPGFTDGLIITHVIDTTVKSSITSYQVDSGLTSGNTYFWRVRAYDVHGRASSWGSYQFQIGNLGRAIDGFSSDWNETKPADVDQWRIENYEFIFIDDYDDSRGAGGIPKNPKTADLVEVRVYSDSANDGMLYFLMKFNKLITTDSYNIMIAIDTDQVSDQQVSWIGDESRGANSVWVDSNAYSEAQYTIGSVGDDFWEYEKPQNVWDRPDYNSVFKSYINAGIQSGQEVDSNNVELAICMKDFGISLPVASNFKLRFTIATSFFGTSGDPDGVDKTDDHSSGIDLIDGMIPGTGDWTTDEALTTDYAINWYFTLLFDKTTGKILGGDADNDGSISTGENVPKLRISEVYLSPTNDTFIEIVCIDDGNPSGGANIGGYYISNYDGTPYTIATNTIINSEEFFLLHIGQAGTNETTSGTDAIIDQYTGTGYDLDIDYEQVALIKPARASSPKHPQTIVDAVVWKNDSQTSFPSGESDDIDTIVRAGEWRDSANLYNAVIIFWDDTSVMYRPGTYEDAHVVSDWRVMPPATPGSGPVATIEVDAPAYANWDVAFPITVRFKDAFGNYVVFTDTFYISIDAYSISPTASRITTADNGETTFNATVTGGSGNILLTITVTYQGVSGSDQVTLSDQNNPPEVTIDTTPADGDTYYGAIKIYFTLIDGLSDQCTATIHYSDDNGSTWKTPTLIYQTDTTDLQSSPSGVQHYVVWDLLADFAWGTTQNDIKLRITPTDTAGNTGSADTTQAFTVANLLLRNIKINEVAMDEPVTDWFELYNKGSDSITVAGFTFDDEDAANLFSIPDTWPEIGPGHYLLIYVDADGVGDTNTSDSVTIFYSGTNTTIDLAVSEDELYVFYGRYGQSSSVSTKTVIDFVNWCSDGAYGPNTDSDVAVNAGIWDGETYVIFVDDGSNYSIGLLPDGDDNDTPPDWGYFSPVDTTPGARNQAPITADIRINEFHPGDDGVPNDNFEDVGTAGAPLDGEWIELYNPGSTDVDLNGWRFKSGDAYLNITTSNVANSDTTTPAGSAVISADGFLVVFRDGDADFSLLCEGPDSIILQNGAGDSIYSIYYGAGEGNGDDWTKSLACLPDGSCTWYATTLITRGYTNEKLLYIEDVADPTPGTNTTTITIKIVDILGNVDVNNNSDSFTLHADNSGTFPASVLSGYYISGGNANWIRVRVTAGTVQIILYDYALPETVTLSLSDPAPLMTYSDTEAVYFASVDGSGTATITPSSICVGDTSTFTITYYANGNLNGGTVTVYFPNDFSNPNITNPSETGFITITSSGSISDSEIINTDTLVISISTLGVGGWIQIVYGDNTRGAQADTESGIYTFTICSQGSGGTLSGIGSSPWVSVTERVVINEYLPDPVPGFDHDGGGEAEPGDEFIEIHNTSDDTINLGGWRITDDEAYTAGCILGGELPPRGFFVLYGDNDTRAFYSDGSIYKSGVGSGAPSLANTGDVIFLFDNNNETVDYQSYTSATDNRSYQRKYDGYTTFISALPRPGDTDSICIWDSGPANARIRITTPASVNSGEAFSSIIAVWDANDDTITEIAAGSVSLSTDKGTISPTSVSLTNGVWSGNLTITYSLTDSVTITGVYEVTTRGTSALTVIAPTNTAPYDTIFIPIDGETYGAQVRITVQIMDNDVEACTLTIQYSCYATGTNTWYNCTLGTGSDTTDS